MSDMFTDTPTATAADNEAPRPEKASRKKSAAASTPAGLRIERRYTRPGEDAYGLLKWELRSASINDDKGKVLFEQKNVEFPASWSQTATNIVVSKYFYGPMDSAIRERSLKTMVDRVVGAISGWGRSGGYFASEDDAQAFEDELKYLCAAQVMAFNSPVWFNVGIEEKPQASACQPYHALVSTPTGMVPIGELVTGRQIGREVYDAHGTTHVVAVKANGQKPVFRVTLNNGQFVEATADHLIKAAHQRRTEPTWLRVDELQPGMRLHLHPHRATVGRAALVAAGDDSEFASASDASDALAVSEAALAGWLQADGFVGQYETGTNRSLTVEFQVASDDEFAWVMAHLNRVFPDVHHHVRDADTKSVRVQRIRLYGEVLRPFVEAWGLLKRGVEIRVPARLFTAPKAEVVAYLQSLFQADGYVSVRRARGCEQGKVGFAVISERWTEDVQLLLNTLGIYSRRRLKHEPREDRHDMHEIVIGIGSERARFAELVGFPSADKRGRLLDSLGLRNQKRCPDLREEAIVSIEPLGVQEVFDIQTASGEYLSNHVAVHNCFIQSVGDTMEQIMDVAKAEAMLFKFGSGTGTNRSTIRSSREKLSSGGTASGPVSFMRGYDAFAGVIKSGGKTRRAAKMEILNDSHPDIREFITAKQHEEKKAWALIEQGYDPSFNGEAYGSVFFQNSNFSVRATDEFMRAVLNDGPWTTRAVTDGRPMETLRAKELMGLIAQGTYVCGDPGMQFDSTIQRWHTCKNSDKIHASNPCVTGDTLVATGHGLRRIDSLVGTTPEVIGLDGRLHPTTRVIPTGVKPVYQLRTRSGYTLKLTADHRVWTENRGDVPAIELMKTDRVRLVAHPFGSAQLEARRAELVGLMLGDGCISQSGQATLTVSTTERAIAEQASETMNGFARKTHWAGTSVHTQANVARVVSGAASLLEFLRTHAVLDQGAEGKRFTDEVFGLDRATVAAMLRGLFTSDGTVADYGDKSQYVSLDSTSEMMLQQVQLLLLGFGIKSKLYRGRRTGTTSVLPDGRGGMRAYDVKPMFSLRISRSSRIVFEQEIGFLPESLKATQLHRMNQSTTTYADPMTDSVDSMTLLGTEPVYDLTEPVTSHFAANGIAVHNCSEYIFLDDTACNLASLNLMKFRNDDGTFDIDAYRHAARLTILAQEILVDNASYPTEQIARNSHRYRTLGLGYANLGAILMSKGLAYDSDAGRAYAAVLTAILCGEAYGMSAEIARVTGPFEGYELNREPMLDVIRLHREHVAKIDKRYVSFDLMAAAQQAWDDALAAGQEAGFKNAQVTVLAPTGTIGFMMDCDTTGVEPAIALVSYKKLVGGGLLKLVNGTVPMALRELGYGPETVTDIVGYIDQNDTLEGAPGLISEHLPVFDCAFKPYNGTRSIHYRGHIKMMAAVQPFLSGAISKTVNMPEAATPEEIAQTYIESWQMGVKCVAIYRDNSKRTQPLNTSLKKDDEKTTLQESIKVEYRPVRRRLPDERQAITHKFSIAGHEGYVTVGMFEDGKPGEIFITMSKEGSVISGLMDSLATMISIAFQYGVPLEVLVKKFAHMRFEPSGFTNNRQIPIAKSIMDYLFRWLELKFLPPVPEIGGHEASGSTLTTDEAQVVMQTATLPAPSLNAPTFASARTAQDRKEDRVYEAQADAPPCTNCGEIMVRGGSCYKCLNCGSTSGCS